MASEETKKFEFFKAGEDAVDLVTQKKIKLLLTKVSKVLLKKP